ncbi:MAG: FAD-dependent thymidylate synthase [Defluviitaleaceae bacterium]|nr:FAD-dependent thymidylate synthase [Defluviitaleaceae bacterium]
MKIHLNNINGIADAIISLYVSKRNWSPDFANEVYLVCSKVLDTSGMLKNADDNPDLAAEFAQFSDWLNRLVKWGRKHTTLLRYIDFSCTVEGMHRAGQDDWDAHAKRFNNRILRSSTRLAAFGYEMSDYYKGKIIPTDVMLEKLGINIPDRVELDGVFYTKTTNGYIREDLAAKQDVKRGLYMLSIPSNFIFKVDLTEWCHVYKMRNASTNAHPEVQQCCEAIADALTAAHSQFDRDLFGSVDN